MAESIILALDNGLLQKLKDADTALDDLGKKSDEITKKIISNFKEASEKGVEAFTQDVKNKIKNLNIDPIKVGLSLDPKAIDDLKKQIAGLGVTVPVGANVTGTTASGNIPNLQAVLDSIVKLSNNLLQSIKDFPFGKSVQASAYTPNQIETLNKRVRAALYRGELNALTELSNKEKERQRNLREQDKENQLRHRERLNQIKIEEARNKLKVKSEIDELKRLAKAYKQMPTTINTKQVGNLIAQSKQSQTVNQRITAVNNLKNALKDLDTTDRRYQRTVSHLNKEIRRQESELRKLGYQMNKVKEHSHNLFNISGQLGRALSLMFSVSQITGYIRKMVDVRKEMELQQRSLQVLLQNKDKANELWNQTLDLAVKSPFRVKELVTYTKQLAAYRIESDKLFETNKMLADVSAGLGVDMQRLILAFGQVKSASFLRGTELRQFTEAGIPMLEELSKYFSEIYGKSVSVAEVFDMISKRMVTFTDVEKVFQRMTGAGGVFFNMQEELSQTTAGLISNLQDSIDLMFNDMGKKNQGIINGVIKAARGLVDNWEVIGVVMKGTLVTLLLYKAATMNISGILDNIAAKWKNLQAAGPLFKENPLEFLKTFKGNAIMFALTAIASLIIKIYAEHQRYKQALREVEEEHEKFRNSISKVENDFADVFKNGSDNIEDYKGKLQELIGIAQQSYNIELDFRVNDLNTIDEVSRKFDELKEKILSFDNLSLEFGLNFVERDDRGWGWFEDYLGKDLKDLSTSQKDIKALASSIRGLISGTIKDVAELDRLNNKAESLMLENYKLKQGDEKLKEEFYGITEQIDVLKNKLKGVDIDIVKSLFPQGVDETEYEYIQRIANAISDLNEEAKNVGLFNVVGVDKSDRYAFANLDIPGRFEKYTKNLEEATNELTEFYKSSHSDVANIINTSLRGNTLGFSPTELIDVIKEQSKKSDESLEDIISQQLKNRGLTSNEQINSLIGQIVKAEESTDVNEEFKKLVETLNKLSLERDVSKYVYNSLKKIATDKEYDELVLNEMLKQAEDFFSNWYIPDTLETLDLDLLPKKEKVDNNLELKQWQKAYNEEVDEILKELTTNEEKAIFLPLKIRTDLQGVATTQEKQLATINEAIDTAQKELDRIEKQKTNLDAKLKSEEITQKQYNDLYTSNIEKRKKLIEQLTHLRDLLGGDDEKSKKGKDTATQRIKDQISLIKELYQEYQKLSKEMGASTAKTNILARFSAYANELGYNISDIDFTNLQGVYDALNSLKTSAESAGSDAMKALTKAMGETSVELELMFYMDERKNFETQIEDMFSDYELSLELDKLNIPKNLASQLFDVDTVDLDDIKTALQNKLNELDGADILLTQQLQDKSIDENIKQSLLLQQKGNKQLREQTESNLRKISDMEQKELEERLKTYTKYLLNEQHERVKIRMETLRMLQEVEDIKEYTPAQRQTITDKIKEEERKKLAQQTWKDFEQSPMYMQMFDDVENMGKGALESLITQMGTLKDELQSMGLPASDLKEILSAINKAEEELERRNPFKNFGKNAKIAFTSAKRLKELEEQRAREQEAYDTAKTNYDNIQSNLAEQTQVLDTLEKGTVEYNAQLALLDLIQKATNYWSKEVEDAESNLNGTSKKINNINDSTNDFYDQLKDIGSITKSVVDGIFQITDAMSGLPEETQLSIDRLQSLSENVFGIAGGIGSIMSGDIVGGITQIVGSLSGLITTFVEWSSGTKEATIQIERQGRILSNLQNKYDRLNEAIDEAWNTQQIKEYNAELEKNLQQQIIAQKAIIAAQESIKVSDRYGSEQWLELQEAQEELQNLYDMQQELQDNIYEKITGGIIDNTIDAASAWVDVWYDAFKETGDGFKGLEENHKEMLLNLVKRQAAMNVAGKFIDQWNAALERYADDGSLSFGEITSWANMIEQDLPALSSQLETFFNAFNGVLGDTQGNLSGLQRGIQGITEQQADILASYLNSIRFIVSDSNYQLKQLVASRGNMNRSESPMVEQLRVIANNTRMLYSLFDGMTSAHSSGGRGLKVVI